MASAVVGRPGQRVAGGANLRAMSSPAPDRRWSPLAWLIGGLLLIAIAAIAGLGAAQLVSTGQAVPTVDPSRLATPTPRPSPTPAATATTRPTATSRPPGTPTVAPTTTALPSPTSGATPRTHVVARGESLSIIAAFYGTTVVAIVELNELENPNHIEVGQVLLIPPP